MVDNGYNNRVMIFPIVYVGTGSILVPRVSAINRNVLSSMPMPMPFK